MPLHFFRQKRNRGRSHFVRFMGKRGQRRRGQFAQIAVIETDYADIFRYMAACIGKLFNQPVSDFVIMADDGRTGFQISLDKVRKKSGILFFLEKDELLESTSTFLDGEITLFVSAYT